MKRFAPILVAIVFGCSPSHPRASQTAPPVYNLQGVSGAKFTPGPPPPAPPVVKPGPIIFTVGSVAGDNQVAAVGSQCPDMLVVEVHESFTGSLVDNVQVMFEAVTPQNGPLGLGLAATGAGLYPGVDDPGSGRAACFATPYVSGPVLVRCSVHGLVSPSPVYFSVTGR